jgi:hypothetical protein
MRTVTVLLALLLVPVETAGTFALEAPTPARADRQRPCAGPRFRTDGVSRAVERRNARRTIRCAFGRVVPGQADAAIRVASCESGLDDEASNGGSYLGLFQHARAYWPGRARALPPRFSPRVGPFHALANAWSAAQMVRGSGWEAWSCSP